MPTKKTSSSPAPAPTDDPEVTECEKITNPVFAASFHLPKNSWHEHRDWGGSVEEPTEYQGFAAMTMTMLMQLSSGNNKLLVGYLGDMLNVLPPNLRLGMMHVIGKGLGLDIKAADDGLNTIEVGLVPRYPPLVAQAQAPQLVTPGGGVGNAELIEKIKRDGVRGA